MAPPDPDFDLFQRWFLGGVAACCGEAATYPLDFTKVRLQLQNELGRSLAPGGGAPAKPLGMVGTASHILRTEGLLAMYGGLSAAALRQFVYGGIGVGQPRRHTFHDALGLLGTGVKLGQRIQDKDLAPFRAFVEGSQQFLQHGRVDLEHVSRA